jgi:general secretion pathway protein I
VKAFSTTVSIRCRGFTLIEVMAALIIVSLGMFAVIQAVSQTANNTSYLREKSVAHWIALNRITELRLAPEPPAVGETTGDVEMAGARWRWTTRVLQTDLKTMRRIDVGVAPIEEETKLSDGFDNQSFHETITGFYSEKIAQPGSITAQFHAPPVVAPTPGQPNPQNPPTPGTPPKTPLPDGDATL